MYFLKYFAPWVDRKYMLLLGVEQCEMSCVCGLDRLGIQAMLEDYA